MTGKEAKEILRKRYKQQNTWVKENTDRITVVLPKGTKDRIKQAGFSLNGFVSSCVLERLDEIESGAEKIE